MLAGMVLLAFNLRPAVTSLGVSLDRVQSGLHMSTSVAGVLTTVPVLCFAVFGSVTASITQRLGIHRTALAALVTLVGGLTLRSITSSTPVFLVATVLALAGIAVGNVSLPPLVKLHFAGSVSTVTAIYSAALMGGAAIPSVVTLPVSSSFGSWRAGLAMWAIVAAIAVLPWLGMLRHDVRRGVTEASAIPLRALLRSRLAWAMAIFFAAQSAAAYAQFGWLPKIFVDAGASHEEGAVMLGIVTAVGLPVPLALPWIMRRVTDQRILVVGFVSLTVGGFAGVLFSPLSVPWLWALMLGVGGCAFPWTLTMLGLRSHSPQGTAALSGFVQGIGYLLAAAGPLGTGLLHSASGGWRVPLVVLMCLGAPMLVAGFVFARPRFVEDDLAIAIRPAPPAHP